MIASELKRLLFSAWKNVHVVGVASGRKQYHTLGESSIILLRGVDLVIKELSAEQSMLTVIYQYENIVYRGFYHISRRNTTEDDSDQLIFGDSNIEAVISRSCGVCSALHPQTATPPSIGLLDLNAVCHYY
jgi:hypothetical protein